MNSNLCFTRGRKATLTWLMLTLFSLGALTSRAVGPSITGTVANIFINDTQATNLYDAATIVQGSTNGLRVYVDFSPGNVGTLNPLPNGAIDTGSNYLLTANNTAQLTTLLGNLTFTPTVNFISVPNTSNVVFTAQVFDAANVGSAIYTTTLHIFATNDAVTLAASGTANITDKQTANPFQNVTVTDPDNSATQPQTMTVSIAGINGYLQVGATGFTSNNLAYTFTGTPAQVGTAMDGLVFVPTENLFAVGTVDQNNFTIRVTDGYVTRTNSSVRVNVTSTNDAPTLTASGMTNITDQQIAFPFRNVTVTDPDELGSQFQTITVSLTGVDGFLLTNGTTFVSNNLAYTYTGTPAQVTTAVRLLSYVPTDNLLPVTLTDTNIFTIRVTDSYVTRTNSSVTVIVTSTNDTPLLTGATPTPFPIETAQIASPFSILTFVDPDHNDNPTNTTGQTLTWSVTLTGPAPLGALAYNGSIVGTTYGGTGSDETSTLDIRKLTYIAPNSQINGTNLLTLAITANDGHGGVLATNQYINLYSVVLPPGLSGLQAGQTVNDNTTVAPFSKVKIQTFNGSAVSVRVQLTGGATNDVRGLLVNLGSFTRTILPNAPSLYQFSGTSEAATAAIAALLFQPTPNRINGSTTEIVTFGLTLVDGTFTNAQNNSTTVIVSPVNDTPTIAGISPLTTIQDNEKLPPFGTVLIGDLDESGLQVVSATVTLDLAIKGSFSAASLLASGFTNTGASYTFAGTPASLSTAIRKLEFVPTPNRIPFGLTENCTFTVLLNDTHGGIVANNNTIIRVASVSGLPVVNVPTPQPISIPVATNIFPFQSVTIADSTTLKVAIRINNPAQGYFTTNSVVSTGFTNRGGGLYYISGVATNVTAAMQLLSFVPSPSLPAGAPINFTISATNTLPNYVSVNHAVILRTVKNSFIVTKLTDYNPTNPPSLQREGTLRKAIADARSGDHITFDIRSGVVGQPDYPAVIRLQAPIVLNNSLVFDGPGAERLTISGDVDANLTADVQLFTVNNEVTMNRLSFAQGYAPFAGGAFEVSEFGSLNLSYCTVRDCLADVYGGGVDVAGGEFNADHCLFTGNSTSSNLGQGGGALSLYTYQPCTITSTTFATNRQNAVGGLGGGAVYAETYDTGVEFDAYFLNCTFRDNVDLANQGSSIRPNNFNTVVQLRNTIVADGRGKNIEMDQSGAVISLGGNISDDATATIFSAGGAATNTFIFRPSIDLTSVNRTNLLALLANNGGPTLTCALPTNSLALSFAKSNSPSDAFYATLGTDQRGFFRDGLPDSGAFERNANQRILIEELRFNPAPPNVDDEFIEFYVPRDSAALNLAGFTVQVDGVTRHTFAAQSLQPGEALVLFSAGAVNTFVPSGVYSQIAAGNLQMNDASGLVSLLNANGQVVFAADYVGAFTSTDPNDAGLLSANYQSLVLSPQFQGVFLPYQRVVAKEGGTDTNGLASPGYDVTGRPLAIGNAPPVAFSDVNATDAHTAIPVIPALANDYDLDITDTIRVVGVAPTNVALGFITSTNVSTLGAQLIINNSPATGATISYDPTFSAYLTALPQGSNVVDNFQYTILDYLGNVANSRGSSAPEIAQNLAKATATVTLSIVGVNAAPTPQNDSVTTKTNLTTREDVVFDFTTATNLLGNDTDPNSDDNSATLTIVSLCETNGYVSNRFDIVTALGATAALDIRFDRNETHIIYNPTNSAILNALGFGQFTNDTFYYSVKDRYGVIGTASVSIKITGVNDRPTANADVLATDEDTTLTNGFGYFLANDTDSDNATTLTVSAVTPFSAHGASVSIVGTNIVYNPNVSTNLNALVNKEFAADTFTVTVTDENALSSNAVVTVTVAGVNDRPISQPDFYTNIEDTLFVQLAPGALANDVEPDINGLTPEDSFRVIPFSINSVTNAYTATNGGAPVVMAADGSFSFDPRIAFDFVKQGRVALDAFKYVVMDHSLSIVANDNYAVTATSSNNILPVLANDIVLSQVGGAFTLTSVTTPNHGGSVSLNVASNAISYTPFAGYVGTETFSYTAADGLGGSDTAVVTVTLTASTLYAIADAFTVARGTTNVFNVLANDSLIPATGANISITSLGPPNNGGTVSFNGVGPNNAINYTPNATNPTPFVETINYVITSGTLTATGTVSVSVINRDNALTANNDSFTVIAGSGNSSFDVLANDLIFPGPNTNYTIIGFVTNNLLGTVSVNAAKNRLIYKPSNTVTNHQESLVFYTVSDGAGGTATASVSFRVVPGGFIANDDSFVVVKNSTNNLPVMINDVFLPNIGQTLFISGIGIGTNAPSHGTVAINGPGTGLIYTPTANFNGSDDFTYEITDGSPLRALGHVHVMVLDVSAAPSNPDVHRVARESANNALRVLVNDYTLPRTIATYTVTALQTNGVHATIALSGSGTNNYLFYTPSAGFIGRDLFSYVFTDTLGNRGTNNVTVTVGDLVPRDDTFNVVSSSQTNLLDVRANDYVFPDTNALRVIAALGSPDQGGSVGLNVSATAVSYTPAPGFVGVERFAYSLKDDSTNLFTATATVNVRRLGSDRDTNVVTMTVVGVNDLPTITGVTPTSTFTNVQLDVGITTTPVGITTVSVQSTSIFTNVASSFRITDKQTVMPFTNVVIGDRDEFGYETNVLTVSLDNAAKGTLTNLGGFVSIAPGVYQMQDSPPALTASLKTLIFVPTENRIITPVSEVTRFTIVADDSYVLTLISNEVTTVLVDTVNDAPVIFGAQGGHQINDKQTVQPFLNIVLTEADDTVVQSLDVRVSLDLAAKGVLQNLGNFTSASNGVYLMRGTAANVTASLRTLSFVPTENRITVPGTEMTRLTISVNDDFTSLPVTNLDTTIFVTATNDPATIFGVQGGLAINDKQTISPFTNVVIADVDDLTIQPLFVTVALDVAAKGVLQNLGGFTNSAPGIYTMLAPATNVSASIRNLVFRPTENRILVPTSELTTLTIFVDDGFQSPLITNALTTITVTATNDAPTIVGTATNSITDKQTVLPFSTVTFADVDNLVAVPPSPQLLTVRVVMDNLDKGNLQNLGGFTQVSNGVFQLTGIAPTVTTALRGILFVPVEHHIPVPTTAQIHFAISADDTFMALPTTNRAAVNVTSVNDTPTIAGTVAGQTVYNRATIKPFSGVLVTELDNDRLQVLRTTITLDSASKGFLSSLGGFSDLGGGVYAIGSSNGVVTAATITTAIRGLVFNPTTANRVSPGVTETTRFTIRVDDFFAPTVVDSNTTVIAIDPQVAKVIASDRTNVAQFGWSVATLRDLAVVGAPRDTTTNVGAAYLYARSLDGSNTWTQIKKLTAPDARALDEFGGAVAISEDTIVVGAHLADQGAAFDVGAAYVYSRHQNGSNQWGFVKKLIASDPVAFDEFGFSVAVSNSLIVVGSPLADAGSLLDVGKVYLFERDQNGANQWGQVKRLLATNNLAGDRFGTSVTVSGDTLAAGSPFFDNGLTNDVGAVFIFGRNQNGAGQWGQVKRLVITNTVVPDHFGAVVSLSGDQLAVGAPLADTGAIFDTGAAYVFNRNLTGTDAWGLVKKIQITNSLANDHFGAALAISEDSLVISAPQTDGPGTNDYGVAYLFQQNQTGSNQWGQVDKWQPTTVSGQDNFGSAVAISRNTIVIGAYNALENGVRYGNAYLFRIKFNNAPQNLLAVPNQSVTVGVPFNFALPAGAFVDPDFTDLIGDLFTYSLGNSPAVPSWLNFDALNGVFTGTPTATGVFPISLIATDLSGATATAQFTITSTGTNNSNFNVLAVSMPSSGANNVLNLRLTGNAGITYRLQQTTNLVGAVWVDVATQTADGSGLINLNVTNPPSPAFFRTVWP